MPAPTPADIERLLAPISTEAPAGSPLGAAVAYDRIREARREDDPTIPQGVWARPLKIADYNAVVALATEALRTTSKDLQVAAWLADAWAHLYGPLGVARGLELCAGLFAHFSAGLTPLVDDDGDDEARARILSWLDDALARRLRLAKLGDERGGITLGEWERAEVPGEGNEGPTREALLTKMSLVGAARWAGIRDELAAAQKALAAVDAVVGAMKAGIPLRGVGGALRGAEALVASVLQSAGPVVDPGGAVMGGHDEEGHRDPDVGAIPSGGQGPITSRAEAYQRLVEAADYLLRTEPHSPVPYLVKRAISWGNLPLAQLLQEFISSADDLVVTHRLLGMRPREE